MDCGRQEEDTGVGEGLEIGDGTTKARGHKGARGIFGVCRCVAAPSYAA